MSSINPLPVRQDKVRTATIKERKERNREKETGIEGKGAHDEEKVGVRKDREK